MIHLDTHVVVWLYAEQFDRLPPRVTELIEREHLVVSPMVQLELTYLHEIERLADNADEVMDSLTPVLGLQESRAPFSVIVDRAAELGWPRDPFDRLIVANALVDDARLISADRTILDNVDGALWD